VTKWIKAKTPQLPVILVTGWGTGLDEEKIKESGVDLVIKKPFEVNEILETVDLFTKIAKRSSSSTVAGHFLKQE